MSWEGLAVSFQQPVFRTTVRKLIQTDEGDLGHFIIQTRILLRIKGTTTDEYAKKNQV